MKMDILNFIKENKKARKIFGKRELKIIEKQLLGVNLTQSEKNRLSRDIREKFSFIRAVSRYEDEFELKKAAYIKKIIEKTKKEILKDKLKDKVKEIWLFGSVAKNKLTLRSDVDIAVLFNKITKKEAFLFRARISGRVSDKVDIQVVNVLPEKIKKEILKTCKVLCRK